ncbi:unnamed protein product, partial [Amoebophrya sp. A25]
FENIEPIRNCLEDDSSTGQHHESLRFITSSKLVECLKSVTTLGESHRTRIFAQLPSFFRHSNSPSRSRSDSEPEAEEPIAASRGARMKTAELRRDDAQRETKVKIRS